MPNVKKTKENQYNRLLTLQASKGCSSLGLMTNQVWHDDPRRLLFSLSRYKFVSRMLSGKKNVLEIGCGDAFGTRILLQEVEKVLAVDFDPVFIEDIKSRVDAKWPFECRVHDMLSGPVAGRFDGIYSLDVIEHIRCEDEDRFVANILASLDDHGVLVIGSPSLQSQAYASPQSREGHVNCKDHAGLRTLMAKYFHNVFLFSMNDEMVHTGYYPMAHYLFAVCTGVK
jgi:2-polyprenyl-3-methyl-5-hydroxy-6-metoxy-1,4-benzoquinol methylase